jgi:hypothetical protein
MRQRDVAEMLGMTEGAVAVLERQHHCPRDVSMERLREYLELPELRARLVHAGYPLPWEDA